MNVGFFGLLGLLFIGLKLMGYLAWSWVWVLAPLWIPLALIALVILVGGIAGVLSAYADSKQRRNKQNGPR
jgi:ABC-type antimicrobial peptide transport system permease subunit